MCHAHEPVPAAEQDELEHAVYVLAASRPLGSLDGAKGVKNVLFGPRGLKRCNLLLHRSRRLIGLSYALGCVPGWLCSFVDVHTGRAMGILALVLQTGPLAASTLVLRYDMVKLLVHTYEFWYLSLLNVLVAVCGVLTYSDIRGLVPVLSAIGYQHTLLIDANYRGTKNTIVLSVLSGAMLVAYLVFIAFELIDRSVQMRLLTFSEWRLDGRDVILNGLGTIILMLLRNSHRKHMTMRRLRRQQQQPGATTTVVQCITYYCSLRLARVGHASSDPVAATTSAAAPTRDLTAATTTQLRLVPSQHVFRANDVVWRRVHTMLRWLTQRPRAAAWTRSIYRLVSFVGVALTLVAVTQPHCRLLSLAAFTLSIANFVLCAALVQRRLLRLLLTSFDFWFVSSQLTLVALALSHLQRWDARALALWSCLLWSHWVLTIDALLPATRGALGVSMRLTSFVMALLILSQVALAVDLVFLRRWQLGDRVVLELRLAGHSFQLRVASLLLSRVISMVGWCGRLLWRLGRRAENELLLLQGAVEYDDQELTRRLHKTPIAIVPSGEQVREG